MKKKLIILGVVALIIVLLNAIYYSFIYHKPIDSEVLNKIKAKKLMIVAHPDDEIIWGGSHLIDDEYFVVCLTNANDEVRSEEFKKAMAYTNDAYIMLDYQDRFMDKKSRWTIEQFFIKRDLKQIINLKNWEEIVTHNPDGEYGHIQHKLTSKYVTKYAKDKNLLYFGYYYEKEIPNNVSTIPDINYQKKITDLVEIYKSQKILKPYGQMLNHESWVSYEDWEKNQTK